MAIFHGKIPFFHGKIPIFSGSNLPQNSLGLQPSPKAHWPPLPDAPRCYKRRDGPHASLIFESMDWFVGEIYRKPMGFYTINLIGGFRLNFDKIIQFYD
jgi:hypothetical protein